MADPQPITQRIMVDADAAIRALQEVAQTQGRVTGEVRESGNAARQASQGGDRQRRSVQRLTQALLALQLAEVKHEQQVRAGVEMDRQAIQASERRRRAIDRISQRLATHQEATRRASESVGRFSMATREAGDEAASAGRKHGVLIDAWSGMRGQLAGLLTGALSIGALTAAIRANTEEMKANAEAANQAAEARLNLQFLSSNYQPGELAAVRRAAQIKGGADALIDMSAAFAELKSKTAFLSDEDRIALFEQLVETSLTTDAPASSLVGLFAKGSQYVADPNRLQAIIRETQNLSPAATPDVLERVLPRVFATGTEVGLTAEQSAGLAVAALQVDEESGETALRNILTVLGGAATPEGLKILEGAGAQPGQLPIDQLNALRQAQLSIAEMTDLMGRENIVVFSGMLRQNQYENYIDRIFAQTQGGDPARESIADILEADQQQARRLKIRQSEARVAELKREAPKAQEAMLVRNLIEEEMVRQGWAPFYRNWRLLAYDTFIGAGFEPESAVRYSVAFSERERLRQVVEQGLEAPPDLDVEAIGRDYEAAREAYESRTGRPMPDPGIESMPGAGGSVSGAGGPGRGWGRLGTVHQDNRTVHQTNITVGTIINGTADPGIADFLPPEYDR